MSQTELILQIYTTIVFPISVEANSFCPGQKYQSYPWLPSISPTLHLIFQEMVPFLSSRYIQIQIILFPSSLLWLSWLKYSIFSLLISFPFIVTFPEHPEQCYSLIFNFDVISDLQKSYKNSTKGSFKSFI